MVVSNIYLKRNTSSDKSLKDGKIVIKMIKAKFTSNDFFFRPAQIISHINRNNLVDSRTTRIYKKLEFNKVFLVKLSIGRISALAFKWFKSKKKNIILITVIINHTI